MSKERKRGAVRESKEGERVEVRENKEEDKVGVTVIEAETLSMAQGETEVRAMAPRELRAITRRGEGRRLTKRSYERKRMWAIWRAMGGREMHDPDRQREKRGST